MEQDTPPSRMVYMTHRTERVLRHAFVVPWETMGPRLGSAGPQESPTKLIMVLYSAGCALDQGAANGQRIRQDPCDSSFPM